MPMTDDDIARAVEAFAKEAIAFSDERSADRIRAMEYYDGVMKDTPNDADRSAVVSRDFRAATKKVLPAIVRTILGSDKVVEFAPVGEGDEPKAEQATDYMNSVVLLETNGHAEIHDAVHDALRLRNGLLKWWWDETTDIRVTRHSGLDQAAFAELAKDDDVEVLEYGKADDGTISATLRRKFVRKSARLACIPNEEFFISPDALCIEDATFVAHNQKLKRYQLVAMGYDKETVAELKSHTGNNDQQSERDTRTGKHDASRRADQIKDAQEIDYWECFVRLDADDDGIAELRRVVFAGGWSATEMLENDYADEAPFSDVVIERKPHEWEGRALFDDVEDIQRVKTVLTRHTLDNLYWQNNQQPIIQEDSVTNPDSVYNPKFGMPIKVRGGTDVRAAIGYNTVPFIANHSFEMLAYMDDMLTDRTGISDASGGLPADALQNMTAKASAIFEQQSLSQIDLMVRTVAEGLRRAFRGMLKLIIQHQDKARTVRLRDQWIEFDPRSWNADMDASVNVGLGAGTRERDMLAMQLVMTMQEKLLAGFGPDNPFVKPDNLYNAASKYIEAAGLRTPSLYITRPDPAEVQQKLQAAASQPSPEQVKAEAQIKINQAKVEADLQAKQNEAMLNAQMDRERMAVDANKEREQRDADLIVKQAEMQNQIAVVDREAQHKLAHDLTVLNAEQGFERERMAHESAMNADKLAVQREGNYQKADQARASLNAKSKAPDA